jgi:hypothetical protein
MLEVFMEYNFRYMDGPRYAVFYVNGVSMAKLFSEYLVKFMWEG